MLQLACPKNLRIPSVSNRFSGKEQQVAATEGMVRYRFPEIATNVVDAGGWKDLFWERALTWQNEGNRHVLQWLRYYREMGQNAKLDAIMTQQVKDSEAIGDIVVDQQKGRLLKTDDNTVIVGKSGNIYRTNPFTGQVALLKKKSNP